MANNQILKDAIAAVIKTNGNNEITGQLMQEALFSIINQFGSGAVFAGVAKPDTVPINGDVVAFYLATEQGTYVNFGGYVKANNDLVVLTNKSGVYTYEDLLKAPIANKTDVSAYAYVKEEYVTQFLVETAIAPTIRVNGVDVTDEIEKKVILKKLDQCFKAIKCFDLAQNEYLLIRQLTCNQETGSVSIGFTVVTNERDMQDINALPTAFYSEIIADLSKPFTLKFTQQYTGRCYFVTMDMSVFPTETLAFNFRNSQQMGSYKTCGIKTSAITYLDKKDIWGTGFRMITGGAGTTWQFPRPYYFHNAVKHIGVSSKEKNLVSITGVSYNEPGGFLAVVIMCCNDDDPENLNINTGRAGFAYLRINIPITDVGVKKYTSFVLTGTSTAEVTIVVDCDYLFANVPSVTTSGFVVSRQGELAQFLVSPSSSGGGGTFNSLLLIDGEGDFQGNFRFAPTTGNWVLLASNNLTKMTRIPDGTESLDIAMSLDGGNSNAMFLDKDMKRISWVYDGADGTINFINVVPPENALFILASTPTSKSSAKITAKGIFELDDTVKQYRSINEGLADKYSGVIFEVNGKFFKKSINGICTIKEYSSIGGGWLDVIPEYEKDGAFKIPTGIMHTNGVNTYTGGTLCAVKNGTMYFYNARDCAIFKSDDDGVTFSTIVDKYSHPGFWDTDDINTESRSAIVVLDNGELLFPIRHRGDNLIPGSTTRRERFFILCRTTNGQTGLEKCFTFSHEDTLRDWLPPTDPQYMWPNHSVGCMLGDFTHDIKGNIIVITEYGAGTSKYWSTQVPPVANNARGISGRAWVSFDFGVTWKKMFDADRKKVGTEEADNNWYYFSSTYAGKMRHMHGIAIDKYRDYVSLTNGDNEDYIWRVTLDDLETWYNSAPAVNPDEKPEYKTTDTFPDWSAKLIVPSSVNSFNSFSSMRAQMMKSEPAEIGDVWGHDASREFAFVSYYNNGELIFEPVFQFEQREDFETEQAFVNSWASTDGFVQDIKVHNGVIYLCHSNGGDRPSRIWATIDGINYKVVYTGDNADIKFAGKVMFGDNGVYLSNGTSGQASNVSGYWKLKIK